MIFYQLDYVVDEVLKNIPSPEQSFLKEYSSVKFSQKEAKDVWNGINRHKWNVSERLERDIGCRVAATDYLENFYEPRRSLTNSKTNSGVFRKLWHSAGSILKNYFILKSKVLQP